MQLNTGEVRSFTADEKIPDDFTQIPKRLQSEATRVLGGKTSTVVDMAGDSGLANWGRGVKRTQDAKAKTKMQKESRKKNRGK